MQPFGLLNLSVIFYLYHFTTYNIIIFLHFMYKLQVVYGHKSDYSTIL